MKKLSICLLIFSGFYLMFTFAREQKPTNKTSERASLVPNEIVLVYDSLVTTCEKEEITKKYGLTKISESKRPGLFVIYRHQKPGEILKGLRNESGVISAEQNAYVYVSSIPNDPLYWLQWNMTRIGLEDAWDLSTGSANTIVAIIDTGVRQTLGDFNQTQFTAGYDFVNDDPDPDDDNGHGSHVCGTIAQSTNNFTGVAGVAYNTAIMPIKSFDFMGIGSYTTVVDGIFYAVDQGAHIINMSFESAINYPLMEFAVDYAWSEGAVLVGAAGFSGDTTPFYPAAYPNTISVSATTSIDTLASYSSYGSTIDICAPGGDYSDYNGDGYPDAILQNGISYPGGEDYIFMAGTSWSAAHVSGVAALVKAANPSLSNVEIRNILEITAEDLGAPGWDQYFGHGLVDAHAAVLAAIPQEVFLFISSIRMELNWLDKRRVQALTHIKVMDTSGRPVAGAVVYGEWSGCVYGEVGEKTGNDGVAILKSPIYDLATHITPERPCFIIKISDIIHASIPYAPELNKVPPQGRICI